MTPATELTFAILGGGVGLFGVAVTLVKGFSWAITRLIREEVTPVVTAFSKSTTELSLQMAQLRASYESSRQSQDKGNAEMHEAVRAIRERLDEHGETIADHSVRIQVLDERTATLRQELGR